MMKETKFKNYHHLPSKIPGGAPFTSPIFTIFAPDSPPQNLFHKQNTRIFLTQIPIQRYHLLNHTKIRFQPDTLHIHKKINNILNLMFPFNQLLNPTTHQRDHKLHRFLIDLILLLQPLENL
ncbi:hypothetical protein Hanom_Chr01g00015941 [Helianthus anomalus]